MSEYYAVSGSPGTSADLSSAAIRAEFVAIQAGTALLPTLAGNGSKIVAVNSGGTALEAITTTGTGSGVRATSPTLTTPVLGVASATSLATSAASPLLMTNGQLITVALTSQTVGGATLTIPNFASVSDTFAFVTLAQTLSNKTFIAPALGTPVSGVATNLTGTAAGLTAGNVTTNANLTGPVTSVGNATAIAAGAIAISKLANGTDGELITWDSSGVITTVAVGTATQVLTSNGAGAAPSFQTSPAASAASQAEMEAASSTTVYVSPGRGAFHPGVAKGWVSVDSTGSVVASYNVTSVTDNGIGDITVTWGTDFSTANHCDVATALREGGGAALVTKYGVGAAGTSSFGCWEFPAGLGSGPVVVDPTRWHVVAYGDQA